MYSDRYVLKDSNGNKVGSRKLLSHLKQVYDSIPRDDRTYPYKVESESTGYKMTVSEETSSQDWRDFSDKCEMALD